MNDHVDVCDEVLVDCMLGCGEKHARRVKNHSETCPNQFIPCQAHHLGCDAVYPRKLLPQHHTTCVLFRIKPYIHRLEQDIVELKNNVTLKQQRIDDLEKKSVTLEQRIVDLEKKNVTLEQRFVELDFTNKIAFVDIHGNVTIDENKKIATFGGSGTVRSGLIPVVGVHSISFHIQSQNIRPWNSFGVCVSKNLAECNTVHSLHWTGWTAGCASCTGVSCGVNYGASSSSRNVFNNRVVSGQNLPQIKNGDVVTLILDRNERRLCFKHNGREQTTYVKDVIEQEIYFFIYCRDGPMVVSIKSQELT
eukprot:TRINITY_DN3031_c2_g1_i1.p1 TRINITY_DN3031_c2_g1~~TRINITY_DN3031_c2_g1_i1.p1  ORF type:complete len:317 (-),score=53.48 TRINITY_DN3031_c2_g1_i1:21-938(-)